MHILFICTANICRSALAEVILKKMLRERGISGIEVGSAGVRNLEGEPWDATMSVCASRAGYVMNGEAKCVSKEALDTADLIICMERFQVVEIQKRLPYLQWYRIHRFNEICFNEPTDLLDPTGDTDERYDYVLKRIEEGSRNLVQKILRDKENGQ